MKFDIYRDPLLKRRGVRAVLLEHSLGKTTGILNSEVGLPQVLYGSAEQWLSSTWTNALRDGVLESVQVLVIDEVHTVETW